MTSTDEIGLLGGDAVAAAAAAGASAKRQKTGDGETRTMLRPWDTAAAQVFNPYGRSTLTEMSQAELW